VIRTFKKGGVHPVENKLSGNGNIRVTDLPQSVTVPVSQHIGAPAKPTVQRGDRVLTGQLIAMNEGFVSTNIHSPVSGKVGKIDKFYDISGFKRLAIQIDVEGDQWVSDIDQTDELVSECLLSPGEIIQKVHESGIVGLGGATFPTHVKLSLPRGKKARYLLINGAECEPYLTSDHVLMLEKGMEILTGVRIMMKALETEKAIIGIEVNKTDAIRHLAELAAGFGNIDIQPLRVKYPQGAEKILIKAVLGREVPSGGLPIDVGVVVFNVGTMQATYQAVQKNKPLFERIVTVTGRSVTGPGNYLVRIGTPVAELIEAGGGLPGDTGKVVAGGPMMGKALDRLDVPVTKGTSGIVVIPEHEASRKVSRNCIRCSKCISVCPMGIEPYLLMAMAGKEVIDRLEDERIMDCMECGSCSFICPANRPLLDYIRLGKSRVNKMKRRKKQLS
jgi:electron transport complex protein RnfC